MSKTAKRSWLGRGRGYLNATGTQARFIVFLLSVLIVFGIILLVFRKLAQIVQFPVFLPVSLLSLLIFIGIAGTIYSHSFIGPMVRIRKAVEQLARRKLLNLAPPESDDPRSRTWSRRSGTSANTAGIRIPLSKKLLKRSLAKSHGCRNSWNRVRAKWKFRGSWNY
jgi:hypothetical protein